MFKEGCVELLAGVGSDCHQVGVVGIGVSAPEPSLLDADVFSCQVLGFYFAQDEVSGLERCHLLVGCILEFLQPCMVIA